MGVAVTSSVREAERSGRRGGCDGEQEPASEHLKHQAQELGIDPESTREAIKIFLNRRMTCFIDSSLQNLANIRHLINTSWMDGWSLEEEGPVRRPFHQPRYPIVRAGPRAGAMQVGGTHSAAWGFHAHSHPYQGRRLHWHCCWSAAHNATS